jgi:ABC-2 type transport system permease protein
MRHALAIAGREIRSLFSTPVAYVLLAGYLVLAGYFFFVGLLYFLNNLQLIQAMQRLDLLQQFNLNEQVIAPSFGSFSVIFIFLVPLITMRAFAEERANGTLELLLTSPLKVWEIVLGKYLAALAVVGALVGLSALYPALLFLYGNPGPEILQTLAGLLGLFGFGAALAALGCFASVLTRNQLIAAVVAIIVGLLLYLMGIVAELSPEGIMKATLGYLAIGSHFDPPLSGEVRSEDLLYYAIFVVFMLTLVRMAVESFRWR